MIIDIETKVRIYDGKVYINYRCLNVPEDSLKW